jgi:hypothetical protein
MAFTNKAFRRCNESPGLLDWRTYPSAEEFAVALMLHGIPTEEARVMLRDALEQNRELAERQRAEAQRRAREADLAEREVEGAFLAAGKLLSEVGYERGRWA